MHLGVFMCERGAAAFSMLSIQARAKCAGTRAFWEAVAGNICSVSLGMRMPRASLALQVMRLSHCIELKDHAVAGRMIDTKNITCALSFWTYWFPVNELAPHGFGTAFKMSSYAYQSWQSDRGKKNNSLLFPWFAFLSLALRFHGFNLEIGLSLRLQTNQQTQEEWKLLLSVKYLISFKEIINYHFTFSAS